MGYVVSRVQGYGVHSFESTSIWGNWYGGYGVHGFGKTEVWGTCYRE